MKKIQIAQLNSADSVQQLDSQEATKVVGGAWGVDYSEAIASCGCMGRSIRLPETTNSHPAVRDPFADIDW